MSKITANKTNSFRNWTFHNGKNIKHTYLQLLIKFVVVVVVAAVVVVLKLVRSGHVPCTYE